MCDRDRTGDCVVLGRALAGASTVREAASILDQWPGVLSEGTSGSDARATDDSPVIGIWRRSQIDGETWYVRDTDIYRKTPHHLWAEVERIGPKGSATRVVLLGESCARGYPYDPLFNCASALRQYLRGVSNAELEIIDLAQCGMTPAALLKILEASAALEPDIYVVFAGNNWVVRPGLLDSDAVATAVAEGGRWSAIIPYIEDVLRRQFGQWIATMESVSKRIGVPVVFVLPASNLQDCPIPADTYDPTLSTEEQGRRFDLMNRLASRLAAGEHAEAECIASELVSLEDGLSGAGLQGLAACALARDDLAEACRLFEAAREVYAYVPMFGISSIRLRSELLKAGTIKAGFTLVDLPSLFIDVNGGRPPGADFFMDDCHMTARGISVAMAATAAAVLRTLKLGDVSVEECLDIPLEIDARAVAQAHFKAAKLLANRDPTGAHDHLRRAIASTREIEEVLAHYRDLIRSSVPFELSDAALHLTRLESVFPALSGPGPMKPSRATAARLEQIIAGALELPGGDILPHPDVPDEPDETVDLLANVVVDDFQRIPTRRRAYVKCFARQTSFFIGVATPRDVSIRVVLRAPGLGGKQESVTLLVNGRAAARCLAGSDWNVVECVVRADQMTSGHNVLTVVWPDPQHDRRHRLRSVSQALRTGRVLDSGLDFASEIYTVYGEIWSVSIRAAGNAHVVARGSEGTDAERTASACEYAGTVG